MTNSAFDKVFEYKVIYVFEIENSPSHKGLLKIGDATIHTDKSIDHLTPNCRDLNQSALKRIKAYTNTVGLEPKLLWSEVAVRTVRKENLLVLEAFRDYQVHSVLKNSGINPVKLGNSLEWFDVDLATAKQAIDAVKSNQANLGVSHVGTKRTHIIFRPEQLECIEKVQKHFKKADRFLINAKMRYGKTFVSLEIIKRCAFKKTIIVTHRPVVDDGWYEDFKKIFYDTNYIYGSKAHGYSVEQLLKTGKPFIYFASVQDLRGSIGVGGKFDKNAIVFSTVWDCIVVDEAHEGTTTALGEDTIKAIYKEDKGTKFLALSGTPFNILDDYDEESIYTWDYIMEQECKSEWDKLHFGDSNPYDELPQMRIYTYSLGDVLHNKNYITFEDKAFNFKEFFRTFTGDINKDFIAVPKGSQIGDFVYEKDVWSFLNLMTKEDANSSYPFSNDEYRSLFKHTLWMVPGVKEARALKKLMLKHKIFGCGQFEIVNVAGNGDEEEASVDALKKVRKAIKEAGDNYTITLSCGKLTTGVTVKEWTAVFMLSGSYSTSASNYLQTIFRVQSPCNIDGKIKENVYVFDFAPDRTLKMVSSAVSVSTKAGKTTDGDKKMLGKFLNYCPVISISGSEMKEYSANKLLQQLKKAYADKVVRNGFDDNRLYNDELLKLSEVDIEKFNDLRGIIGSTKAQLKSNDITVNDQGLTNEEYEEVQKLSKKKKKDLTEEDKARLEELKRKKKLREDAISILRGISIRMPMLIYGANIPYGEEITLNKFVDTIDSSSWEEFMPKDVTKEKFKDFQKYYDEEIFIAAGRRIRNIARHADELDPTERVIKIASLFSYFKNPDKETVLTPWRVVNMHMCDTLGGWDFWDENHNDTLEKPRYVEQSLVTKNVFGKINTKILEINSKTGLYPLFVAYSCYRERLNNLGDNLTLQQRQQLWQEVVKDNVYVICKTPMAKTITKRTLLGYTNAKINAHYFDDLINTLINKPNLFLSKISKGSYWKKGEDNMKFDAIVGNPPYQINTTDKGAQAIPVYDKFVSISKKIEPKYLSMIMPSRWFASNVKSLSTFRTDLIKDNKISKIVDYTSASDCFEGVNISGGISYFLWQKEYEGNCKFINVQNGLKSEALRNLNEFPIIIRFNEGINILHKVQNIIDENMVDEVSSISPFGIPTTFQGRTIKKSGDVILHTSKGERYIDYADIKKGMEYLSNYKVLLSQTIPGKAGEMDKDGMHPVFASTMKVIGKNESCSHSYILIGNFDTEEEANNLLSYLKTKFVRFLTYLSVTSIHLTKASFVFVPKVSFNKTWTDAELYEKFDLEPHEIAFIESIIKPM